MAINHPLAYWLALLHTPSIGAITFHKLLALFDTPEAVFANRHHPELNPKLAQNLAQPNWAAVEKDLQWLQKHPQNHILTIKDPDYPQRLKNIHNPPPLLFAHGNIDLLNQPQMAIVGSRNPTRSGENTCLDFSEHLANMGLVITSGLAIGIDAMAHHGALKSTGKTIAVTGTGLDIVYPARHRDLAHQIARQGLLVSEFPTGTSAKAQNFPSRNRIISGMSVGVLVVEAALKSGSLITAREASEQGREVFAIPGSIHNPLSKGCNTLIKQGAKLVDCAQDIIEELPLQVEIQTETPIQQKVVIKAAPLPMNESSLDGDYEHMLGYMNIGEPMTIDALVEACQLNVASVSSMLLVLELQGRVSSQAGGLYMRQV